MPKETKCYLIEYEYMSNSHYSTCIDAESLKECLTTFITEYIDINDRLLKLFTKALVGCDDDSSVVDMFNVFIDTRKIVSVHVIAETLYPKE